MKQCSICKKTLSLKLFYTDQSKKDGRGSKCKNCARKSSRNQYHNPKNSTQRKEKREEWISRNKEKIGEYQRIYRARHREKVREYNRNYKRTKQQKHRLEKYGIDQETYDFLKERQQSLCGICGRLFEGKISPHVDHCHKTGKVRGLLCWNCNIRLGYLESEVFRAQAEKYLQCEYIEIKNKES